MVLFGVAVRRAVQAGDRGSPAHAAAAFAGAIVTAVGITFIGMITLAAADASDKHNDQTVVSLGYLADANWVLFVAGLAAFYLASGLGALRGREEPAGGDAGAGRISDGPEQASGP